MIVQKLSILFHVGLVNCQQFIGFKVNDLFSETTNFLSDYPFIVEVSWVRHRDVHILTAGEQTFTTDQRFSAKHNTDDEWVLVIKYVQVRYSVHQVCSGEIF